MWDILSKILNVFLGLWVFYLYLENRKLKRFDIDRDIKLKQHEINMYNEDRRNKICSPSFTSVFGADGFNFAEYDKEYGDKVSRLTIELEYLKRLKKYRWPFGKV